MTQVINHLQALVPPNILKASRGLQLSWQDVSMDFTLINL